MFVKEAVYTTKTLERYFPGTIRGTAFVRFVTSYKWIVIFGEPNKNKSECPLYDNKEDKCIANVYRFLKYYIDLPNIGIKGVAKYNKRNSQSHRLKIN